MSTISFELYTKIYNFLTTSKKEHITAISVIYLALDEDPWIPRDALRDLVNNAILLATNLCPEDSARQQKFLNIPIQV
jgi:hypothetical protein